MSIKAREADEEKQAMAEYGSSDSGARLGEILGAAIKRREKDREQTGDEDKDETDETDEKDEKDEKAES